MKYHFLKTFVMRGRENARQTCEFVVRFCLAHGKPFFSHPCPCKRNTIIFKKPLPCAEEKTHDKLNSLSCVFA
jgi:hypothetical protein